MIKAYTLLGMPRLPGVNWECYSHFSPITVTHIDPVCKCPFRDAFIVQCSINNPEWGGSLFKVGPVSVVSSRWQGSKEEGTRNEGVCAVVGNVKAFVVWRAISMSGPTMMPTSQSFLQSASLTPSQLTWIELYAFLFFQLPFHG